MPPLVPPRFLVRVAHPCQYVKAVPRSGRGDLLDLPAACAVPFRCGPVKGGYRVEAFVPAAVLNGFDPEEHPRLGVYYAVRDTELGEQTPAVGSDFPYADDPSLWQVLELTR